MLDFQSPLPQLQVRLGQQMNTETNLSLSLSPLPITTTTSLGCFSLSLSLSQTAQRSDEVNVCLRDCVRTRNVIFVFWEISIFLARKKNSQSID